jgi:hypothetical protein
LDNPSLPLHEVLESEFVALPGELTMKLLPIAATVSGTFAGSSYRVANIGDKAELILGSQLQKAVGHGGRANTEV